MGTMSDSSLDISGSTGDPSGVDVDRDGVLGVDPDAARGPGASPAPDNDDQTGATIADGQT